MGSNDLPYRRYPRANFHDYNGGTYFVTVCTRDKRHYLGEIYNGDMHLSVLGKCLENNLRDVSSHFTDITVPMFVVMPNHFHAIISIVGSRPVATATQRNKLDISRFYPPLTPPAVATGRDPTATLNIAGLTNAQNGRSAGATKKIKKFLHRANHFIRPVF